MTSNLHEWNKDYWNPVTKSVYDCFKYYVEPLEGHPKWDAGILGGTTTEDVIRKFAIGYNKSDAKTKLLDDVIRNRKDDPDDMMGALVQYCKDGTVL